MHRKEWEPPVRLGYYLDHHDASPIGDRLSRMRASAWVAGRGWCAACATWAWTLPGSGCGRSPAPPRGAPWGAHIARALVEGGYVATVREAFDRYIGNDGPATWRGRSWSRWRR